MPAGLAALTALLLTTHGLQQKDGSCLWPEVHDARWEERPKWAHDGENLFDLEACYVESLRSEPMLTGSVNVDLVVLPNGRQKSLQLSASTLPKSLERCLAGKVEHWRFPSTSADAGESSLSYAFQLRTRSQPNPDRIDICGPFEDVPVDGWMMTVARCAAETTTQPPADSGWTLTVVIAASGHVQSADAPLEEPLRRCIAANLVGTQVSERPLPSRTTVHAGWRTLSCGGCGTCLRQHHRSAR